VKRDEGTSGNYRPWSTWPRGGGLRVAGAWQGKLDHDCTARQGIMDTIIRERLEVLVIFLLPRLARTVIHIFVVDLHTASRSRARARAPECDTNCGWSRSKEREREKDALRRIKRRSPTLKEERSTTKSAALGTDKSSSHCSVAR